VVVPCKGTAEICWRYSKNVCWASPGFPVDLVGLGKLHAAFLNESRTRGRWWRPRGRKSGSPTVLGPRTPHGRPGRVLRTRGTRPISFRPGYDTDAAGLVGLPSGSRVRRGPITLRSQNCQALLWCVAMKCFLIRFEQRTDGLHGTLPSAAPAGLANDIVYLFVIPKVCQATTVARQGHCSG
jgi:hypothetical protein